MKEPTSTLLQIFSGTLISCVATFLKSLESTGPVSIATVKRQPGTALTAITDKVPCFDKLVKRIYIICAIKTSNVEDRAENLLTLMLTYKQMSTQPEHVCWLNNNKVRMECRAPRPPKTTKTTNRPKMN